MNRLPNGIWYDAPNRRYRVRRYKNRKPFLVGYFPTLDEAIAAHAELDKTLDAIPKRKRGERDAPAPVATSFFAMATAALSHGEIY